MLKERTKTSYKAAMVNSVPKRVTTCHKDKKTMVMTDLQWPYRIGQARLIDGSNTLWAMDAETLKKLNLGVVRPHVHFETTGKKFYPEDSFTAACIAQEAQKQLGRFSN